jgi:hypothetical protein
MTKKDFFQVPSASNILGDNSVREISNNLIDEILETGENEACVIMGDFIPKKFKNPMRFLRYGSKVCFSDFLLDKGLEKNEPKSGYSEWCEEGGEKFLRTFSLYQNLEGSKIVRYCNDTIGWHKNLQAGEFGVDNDTGLISCINEGGVDFFNVNVPSRRMEKDYNKVKFECIPRGSDIGDDLRSLHWCESKKFGMGHGLHSKTGSRVDAFCAHDFAAYMLLKDYRLRNEENFDWTESSFLTVPDKKIIDFYDKLDFNCLIHPPHKDKPRRLNVAEKEIFLFGFVGKFGFNESFSLMSSKK